MNKVKAAIAHTKAARWTSHINTFLGPREFAIGWDKLTEAERTTVHDSAPQGSPLSPILFLIYLAPMLQKVEAEIAQRAAKLPAPARVSVYLISYVDDISVLVTSPPGWRRGPEAASAVMEAMQQVDQDLKEAAREHGIVFAPEKEETVTFRAGKRSLKAKSCKVLGVQIDECLLFHHHMEYRANIARKAWGAFSRLGDMRKGLSPTSWRQLYTGMIRPMMLWGMELAWRTEDLSPPHSAEAQRTGVNHDAASGGSRSQEVHRCIQVCQHRDGPRYSRY